MYKLKIIIGSTRPGRKGPSVTNWVADIAGDFKDFDTEIIDLADINLPFLDEPNHPRFHNYIHQHTKDWSRIIDEGDAFIFITPEYNHGYPAVLKNAIDYLHNEWMNKPAAFVSYGGLAGGSRAVETLKQVLGSFNMIILRESVSIPFFGKYINSENIFIGDETLVKNTRIMLKELLKWSAALKVMREEEMLVQ